MPPKLFHRFFRWYCHPRLRDHIEGDLLEVYQKRVRAKGKRHADLRFMLDVLTLFRRGIVRPMQGYRQVNTYGMYRSYFTIGWRNMIRRKGYSLINIGGLAVGMAVAMLIGLWIHDELTFNRNHHHYNKIGQVLRNGTLNGETMTTPYLPVALGDELLTKYGSNFKHVVMAWPIGDHIVSNDDKKVSFRGEFFQPDGVAMFTLNMLEGSSSALKEQHAIILSQSAAKAIFGTDRAMDKSLKIDNAMEVKVTGIYRDFPRNSQFYDVKFFAPWDLLVSNNQWIKSQGFTNNFLHVYVEMEDNIDAAEASSKIKDAILKNIQSEKEYVAVNPQLLIHPMEKWHLWSEWKNGVNGGMIQTVWLFGIVGVFVLLLACINFMNLSTAQSEKRAKEVGIRKTVGSRRSQLVKQFMSESFLVVIISSLLSLAIVTASLEWFNQIAMKNIALPWSESFFWIAGAGFVVITVLLAGSYPAFYLSSFNSIRVLKGSLGVGRFASLPRKVLVVVQFTVSVTLIIGTVMVYKQVQFAKDRPVGYDRNGLVMVQMVSGDFYAKYDVLKAELKNTGVVTGVATSSSPVTDIWNSNGGFDWKGKDPSYVVELATFTVSAGYGNTVGWEFTKGRDLSDDKASDSAAFVINESAGKLFGFPDPIGEVIEWQSWWTNGRRNFTIVGVIKDQVVKSPYDPAMPAVYFLKGGPNWITFRIDPKANMGEALPKVQAVFAKVIPSVPFVYKFVDQEFAAKFASEERIGVLSLVFTVLAILISCLGLFGLTSFVAERRAKEIGIRKVIGASIFNLWRMLSGDFAILVVIACCLAVPIAYYFLNEWLAKFNYRTDMSWWIFVISCSGALVVTLVTVSYQTIRAAWANPVKSLRSE